MEVYAVDRIEGDMAVLVGEDALSLSVPVSRLPQGIKEGSVLRVEGDAYVLDPAQEEVRRQRILALQEKLRHKHSK